MVNKFLNIENKFTGLPIAKELSSYLHYLVNFDWLNRYFPENFFVVVTY